jgi:outer membrane biosynthesis protein TonB
MISESGLVTDAFALNGHPFFRDISVEAARQWIFKPTMLNDRPVRVTGVITFNFRLDQ